MSQHYKTIIKQLPTLSPEELKQVATQAKALASVLGKPVVSVGEKRPGTIDAVRGDHEWLLEGFMAVIHDKGLKTGMPPLHRLAGKPPLIIFESKSPAIRAELLSCITSDGLPVRTNEKISLGYLAASALYDHLCTWGAPDWGMMFRLSGRTMMALDESYPGYRASGMYRWLVNAGAPL